MNEQSTNTVTPFGEIGVALSGGGFRAASFSLGCLSYLERVVYKDSSLLKRVKFISSASGGSIAAIYYAMEAAKKSSVPFSQIFESMYDFLDDSKTVAEAFKNLRSEGPWKQRQDKGRNLINAFAVTYDHRWFNKAELGDLVGSHLEDICINATEFDFGISFRFLVGSGRFGNSKITMPKEVAHRFKLGDILAASSCFPMGFEPIMMPFDFAHEELSAHAITTGTTNQTEFGLMDGGITDNQGIHSFLLAEDRKAGKDQKGYDLFVYCDVASPYMDGYKLPKEERSFIKSRSLQFFINLFKLAPLGLAACVYFLIKQCSPWWLIVLTTLSSLATLTYVIFAFLFNRAKAKATKQESTWLVTIFNFVNGLLFTRTSAILQMISARVKSAGILVGDVYLKQIRRLTIDSLYENENSGDKWKTHAIANLVYEFSSINTSRSSDCKSLINVEPSSKMTDCADLAREMDTTLWFDKFHVQAGRREALIATGQFTTCYNLIEYICRLEKKGLVTPELKDLQKRMLADWNEFANDPYFLAIPEKYSRSGKW